MISLLSHTGPQVPRPGRYQQLTERNAQEDNAEIIKALSVIRYNNLLNDLMLLNYYNEMPISFGATVEHIENGIVVMAVHSFQAVSMMMQNMTFIRSSLFPHWVLANVLKIDRENNLAYLALFSYVHNPSDRRMHVRMKLPEMVEASFHSSTREVPGAVREISFGGVAIVAPMEKILKEREKGIVSLLLPDDKLDIPGVFLQCQEVNSQKKHIFQLKMNAKNERVFSNFIYQQQSKIMGELKKMERAATESGPKRYGRPR